MRPIAPRFILAFAILSFATALPAAGTRVAMKTSLGTITLELEDQKAPETVKNFLAYADAGFYDGTIFHRVIGGFMIQGGGFTADLDRKPTRSPIPNEADNGLKNTRGTLAMARTPNPHSASSQFFINLVDNDALNFRSKDPQGWGYAVFGRVVGGMDVVDKIAAQPTGRAANGMRDVPETPIVIESVSALTATADQGSSQ